MTTGRVAVQGVTKRFGPVPAVDGVTLDVVPGEILALLGPSGCGKTTFLRLVAGFERPDAGSIQLAGVPVAGPGVFVSPERRRIGMVFQDYALFPHLTVAANVAFGLTRSRRLGRARTSSSSAATGLLVVGARARTSSSSAATGLLVVGARARTSSSSAATGLVGARARTSSSSAATGLLGVGARAPLPGAEIDGLLELVGLTGLGARLPHELSGGQQQRVALARALAPGPEVVLLDEPFSNLDAALRASVRDEVRRILRAAAATAVFVTHDQEEALSLADRVAVMRAGRLCQVDTPDRLYARPADAFVATFVGDADVIPGWSDGARIDTAIGWLRAEAGSPTGAVSVVVRPETLRLRLDGGGPAQVRSLTYFGHDQLVEVELVDGTAVRSRMGPERVFEPGDRVSLSVSGEVVAFPAGAGVPDPTPAAALANT